MEKHTTRAKKHVALGLLTAILFCGQEIHSQNQSAAFFSRADAEKLEVVPKDDIFFTNSEAQFILKIPSVSSNDVQTELPTFPDGVIFNSSKKSDYISSLEAPGTEIDLWFTFRQTGNIALPPLVIYVKGRRHSIKFKPVDVYENPRTILPKMIVEFDNGQTISADSKKIPSIELESDKAARFTIYMQYAVQAQQFVWKIPKDSLFKELKRYADKDSGRRPSDFSTEKIPLAYFEWTPFAAGTTSLPEIRMMVTAYSGRSVYLSTPECVVTILPAKNSGQNQKAKTEEERQPVYAYAFAEESEQNSKQEKKANTPFDCARIAELRSMERRALFSLGKIRAQRIEAESAAGIKNSENESNYCVFFIIIGANGLLFALAAIFLALKKRFEAAVIGIAALGLFFFSIFAASLVVKKFGIIVGGEIRPIPEDSAMTKSAVSGGSRVQIKEEVKDWYYIVYNENGGWIKKENLAVIK